MKFYSVLCYGLILLCLSTTDSLAQGKPGKCGWPYPSANTAAVLLKKKERKKTIRPFEETGFVDNDSVYTLPVVVHVIHPGTPVGSVENPSDASIHTMIDNLNTSWRKQSPSNGGVDMKIQFQLAVRSPIGTTTAGIVRVDAGSVPDYVSGGIALNTSSGSVPQDVVKSLSRWPNTDYINIWIVNRIDGDAINPGGFSFFPQYNDAGIDGIVMNASVLANTESKLIAHEMGHVFELFHTFYDEQFAPCPRLDSCEFYGDQVCDTESSPEAATCTNINNPCTGMPYQVADPSKGYTVLNNYMNYTDCAEMFTAGQKLRVRNALLNFRPGLINSKALTPPPALIPLASCAPAAANGHSIFYGVERVQFNSIHVYSSSSANDRANFVDRTVNQQTTLYKGTKYTLQVTGSFFNPHIFKAYIDYNNNGSFSDSGEELLSTLSFTGEASAQVTIPIAGVAEGTPLRLRIVADNPGPSPFVFPTSCQLNGDVSGRSGQIEDYTVIIAAGDFVTSVQSGAWDNPATWNCNCVPVPGDLVRIKSGHVVTVTEAMGLVEFTWLTVETGGTLDIGTNANFKQKR